MLTLPIAFNISNTLCPGSAPTDGSNPPPSVKRCRLPQTPRLRITINKSPDYHRTICLESQNSRFPRSLDADNSVVNYLIYFLDKPHCAY